MIATLLVNVLVVRYEGRAGRRLGSEVLRADAHHTRSDVLTSLAVILALVGVRLGWPILDPAAALLVAVFIGHAAFQIARDASNVLADHVVIDDAEIQRVVAEVPEAVGCHRDPDARIGGPRVPRPARVVLAGNAARGSPPALARGEGPVARGVPLARGRRSSTSSRRTGTGTTVRQVHGTRVRWGTWSWLLVLETYVPRTVPYVPVVPVVTCRIHRVDFCPIPAPRSSGV